MIGLYCINHICTPYFQELIATAISRVITAVKRIYHTSLNGCTTHRRTQKHEWKKLTTFARIMGQHWVLSVIPDVREILFTFYWLALQEHKKVSHHWIDMSQIILTFNLIWKTHRIFHLNELRYDLSRISMESFSTYKLL